MKLLNAVFGYKAPPSFFTEMQVNAHKNLQKIAKLFGSGIVEGMVPTRDPANGSVSIGAGYGWDADGRMINVEAELTLDFSSLTRPAEGKYKKVAVLGVYHQLESGKIQDEIGKEEWQEKTESIQISFIEGAAADSAGEAVYAEIPADAFLLADLLFDHDSDGCVDIDLIRRPELVSQKKLKDELLPVGTTYIQFPEEKSPAELGWPGIWTNVSSELAGDFIRFEGGNALLFEEGRQDTALINHYHEINLADAGGSEYNKIRRDATGNLNWSYVTGVVDDARYPAVGTISTSETRPVNKTVRKWKRIA